MEIKSLSATFGRLENQTLPLSSGLNVIEAANESGKTTWMAFLRVMLYGLNTRDRSPYADKHRYLPWSGSPMHGRMDLLSNGDRITIRRSTARANSPMGSFAAEYTDTTTPVPDLTSATLGETLLGVPQDVFERSAFIRQSGVPIDQSNALERRIAALITTGEEDSSYTDAADRLRKQLTRRRYNKTGLLPQLENDIASLENTLREIESLESTVHNCETESDNLSEQETYLRRQLDLHTLSENAQRVSQLNAARADLSSATAVRAAAEDAIAPLPTKDELSLLIGDFSAIETLHSSCQNAHTRAAELSSELQLAEQELSAHPFAPKTPDEASAAFLADTPRPRSPRLLAPLSVTLGFLLALLLQFVAHLSPILSVGAALLVAGLSLTAVFLSTKHRLKEWESEVAAKRATHEQAIAAYSILYNAVQAKRAAHRAADETYQTLAADHQRQLDSVLNRVRQFHPAQTLSDARKAAQHALSLHAAFDAAVQSHKQAQLRFDLLAESVPQDQTIPTELPTLSRADAEQKLRGVTARLTELRRAIHTAQGRIQALGDPLLLRADLESKRRRHEVLTKEYDAIALAQAVLSAANTTMQNRFSPALGEKAASIFTKLTKGKYNKVLLDRKLIPSAQECGALLSHEVHSLSQGAADQLYLAVRLAICDLVLPAENSVPIFLDDALVTFDDERMAAALDLLVELSEHRQIVLFTCQQRELRYLRAAHPDRFHAVTLS